MRRGVRSSTRQQQTPAYYMLQRGSPTVTSDQSGSPRNDEAHTRRLVAT
jgi:hypothetical protein